MRNDFTNVKLNMSVTYVPDDNSQPCYGYLTIENKRTNEDLVKDMYDALESNNEYKILNAANAIINNDKRNRKIMKHEEIIAAVTQLILNSVPLGECIRPITVANIIEKHFPELCNHHITKTYDGSIRKYTDAPMGAVSTAIKRLVKSGTFEIRYAEYGNKVYVRICE